MLVIPKLFNPKAHKLSHESGGADKVNHDLLDGFATNEHIDWTDSTGKKFVGNKGGTDLDFVFGGADIASIGSKFGFDFGKRAFRSGKVTGTEWSGINVGSYSFASGLNCKASGAQSFASGSGVRAENTGSTAIGDGDIKATGAGCFAAGQSKTLSLIQAGPLFGAFAQGLTYLNDEIVASGVGSFAQGSAYAYSTIKASGPGSFAQGFATSTSAIYSTGSGSFAQGFANSSSYIYAKGIGSFAQGFARTGNRVYAYGCGSFAQGYATVCSISAVANNAVQFGMGYNAIADSLQVGGGVSLRAAGNIFLKETTEKTNIANFGQLWCKNNAGTTELWFSDDTGTDTKVAP